MARHPPTPPQIYFVILDWQPASPSTGASASHGAGSYDDFRRDVHAALVAYAHGIVFSANSGADYGRKYPDEPRRRAVLRRARLLVSAVRSRADLGPISGRSRPISGLIK